MAIIANPLYDTVFKFLMEDKRVSSIIIGRLLQRKIKSITQRNNDVTQAGVDGLRLLRLDYAAVVEDENGDEVEVCIELQRASTETEVERFRQYLATQYSNKSNVDKQGNPLHIISIYFLGHNLDRETPAVMYVDHVCRDEGMQILKTPKLIFVEAMTHNLIIVQTLKLKPRPNTLLERLLDIFRIEPAKRSDKTIEYDEREDEDDAEVVTVLRRLEQAAANEKLKKEMLLEDELLTIINNVKTAELAREEAKHRLAETEQELTGTKQELAGAKQELAEAKQELAEAKQELAETKKTMTETKDELKGTKDELKGTKDELKEAKEMVQKMAEALRKAGLM